MQEDAAHLQNKVSVCDPSDTAVTQRRSLKVLKERAAVYEAAPAACKGSLGLSLRKMHAAVVNAEDRTGK